jgi:hypothetical protein
LQNARVKTESAIAEPSSTTLAETVAIQQILGLVERCVVN